MGAGTRWRASAARVFFTLLEVYLLAASAAFLAQRWLIYPRWLREPRPAAGEGVEGLERWSRALPEGGAVEAWFLPGRGASAERPGPLVVVAHGNAELVEDWPRMLAPYCELGVSVLLPEYRGYGRSAGYPTQALLDLFTIQAEMGKIDGLTITLLGDLKHGRTVHSLARLLSLYDVKINYVSPEILRMPAEIMEEVSRPQAEYRELDPVLADSDVLYVTRVQKERFDDPAVYEAVKGTYTITLETMTRAKEDMIVMHPLPRVGEISEEVDDDSRAAYFRQMEYGLYTRMALLAMVLGKA